METKLNMSYRRKGTIWAHITAKPWDWHPIQLDQGLRIFRTQCPERVFLSQYFVFCVGFISRQVLPVFWQDHNALVSCLLSNLRGKGVPLSWYFPKSPGIFSTYSKWIMCQFRNQSLWPGGSNQLPLPEVVSGWEKCCYPKVSLSSQVRDGWWSSKCNKHPGCKEKF